jgi:hypothetical protein
MCRVTRVKWLAAGMVLLSAVSPALPALNGKVLEFASSKKGETVGDGECTALAHEALRYAGAKRFIHIDREKEYVWGTPVESLDQVIPGDVLQFDKAVFKGRKVLPNGAYFTWRFDYPRHTAIVTSVKKVRKAVVFTILHQNVVNKAEDESLQKIVREGTVNMAELCAGTVKAYRPIANVE